jgi:hypothetical protein
MMQNDVRDLGGAKEKMEIVLALLCEYEKLEKWKDVWDILEGCIQLSNLRGKSKV